MKTRTKVVALIGAAVLLVAGTVFTTVAFLTSKDSVVNTFTVGKVNISLDETDVDVNGVKDGETRVKVNEYKLIPGKEYVKDPILHVAEDSEPCWVFVKVENGLAGAEAAGDTTIAAQILANDWVLLDETTDVYAYNTKINGKTDLPIFAKVVLADDAAVESYATAEIKVTGYAVQAEGFDSAAAAWTDTFGKN